MPLFALLFLHLSDEIIFTQLDLIFINLALHTLLLSAQVYSIVAWYTDCLNIFGNLHFCKSQLITSPRSSSGYKAWYTLFYLFSLYFTVLYFKTLPELTIQRKLATITECCQAKWNQTCFS